MWENTVELTCDELDLSSNVLLVLSQLDVQTLTRLQTEELGGRRGGGGGGGGGE